MEYPNVVEQNVCVQADIVTVPGAKLGDIEASCVGLPVTEKYSREGAECTRIVRQLICVRFPITFSVRADVNSAGIVADPARVIPRAARRVPPAVEDAKLPEAPAEDTQPPAVEDVQPAAAEESQPLAAEDAPPPEAEGLSPETDEQPLAIDGLAPETDDLPADDLPLEADDVQLETDDLALEADDLPAEAEDIQPAATDALPPETEAPRPPQPLVNRIRSSAMNRMPATPAMMNRPRAQTAMAGPQRRRLPFFPLFCCPCRNPR
jgi:hypothetical protein